MPHGVARGCHGEGHLGTMAFCPMPDGRGEANAVVFLALSENACCARRGGRRVPSCTILEQPYHRRSSVACYAVVRTPP